MTQVLEGVLVGLFDELIQKKEECKKPPEDAPPKQARINKGVGELPECSAQRLYDNMTASKDDRGYRGGLEPYIAKDPPASGEWSIKDCSGTRFPLQAHHIIPKNYLPDLMVCAFLGKGYTKHPKVQLSGDTQYDTDHAYNGYCLPYASALVEWKSAKDKDKLANNLMALTMRQLHQGSHKQYQYQAEAPVGEEEEDEDVGHADAPGYLAKIGDLLDLVAKRAFDHTKVCSVCKPEQSKKTIHPRESVVRHVHQVSGIVKVLRDANQIFVSQRAYNFYAQKATNPELPDWLPSKAK